MIKNDDILKAYLVREISSKISDDPKDMFKLDTDMLKVMEEDPVLRLYQDNIADKEKYLKLKRLLKVDYTF